MMHLRERHFVRPPRLKTRCTPCYCRRTTQRGQALLVVILLLSLGAIALVYGTTSDFSRTLSADSRTRDALERARQVLVGRAVADANRPGSLPCPDSDDDGSADLFVGNACPRYLGRLPWRTLGVGDIRDEVGERLWYALSPDFRDHPAAPALNSDTKGTLTLHHNDTSTTITSQAVAIVFAPGVLVPGQLRDDVIALCSTTGTKLARNRCAANYLETSGKVNNATLGGPYVAATAGGSFNDKVATVLTADLMPLLEQRVALELRNALTAYRAASSCRCYPWADSGNDGASDIGANRGRVPHLKAAPEDWGPGMLPAYFGPNDWARVIYYAVGRTALADFGKTCKTCADADLSIDGTAGYDVVLIAPGYAGPGRPSANWIDYLDDAENRNADDRFVTPSSRTSDRDSLFRIAGAASGCARNARILVGHAPCGTPQASLVGACQSAAAHLAACPCSSAASTLLKPPCTHALHVDTCRAAVGVLQGCL